MSSREKGIQPLRLELNASSGVPLYRQIMDGLKALIAAQVLQPGDQLPSIRDLSAQLRINPSSAVKAYSELQHEQVIALDHGRGTFVSADPHVVAFSRNSLLDQQMDALLERAHLLGYSDADVLSALSARIKHRKSAGRKT